MMNRPTLFQMLRQERHPLAILAMLALGLRVTVIMAGLAISPGVAAQGFGILCQQSPDTGSPLPLGGQHDPAHCICGTTCTHLAHFTGIAPPAVTAFAGAVSGTSSPDFTSNDVKLFSKGRTGGLIRAPPATLT